MAFNLRSQTPTKQIDPTKKQGNNTKNNKTKTLESRVDSFLGNVQEKASKDSDLFKDEEPVDNVRHAAAGRYTQESISRRLGNGPMAKVAGVVGSNLLGASHEVNNIVRDERPWKTKLRESGEDMFNNAVGSVIGALPGVDAKKKTSMIKKMSFDNLLPDGYSSSPDEVKKGFSKEVYFKDNKGKRTTTVDRYSNTYNKNKKKNG